MIRAALEAISIWAVPVMLVGIPLAGLIRKVKVYDVFIEGAKEGFDVAMKIIPFLVGILVAIGMFRASGAMELLLAALRPVAAATGFPAELIPLAILRSLSGSGSLALTTDLIKTHGPDSLLARMAATMYGSSETTFYVLAVYFGAVGVQAHEARGAGGARRRRGRGDRDGGGVHVVVLEGRRQLPTLQRPNPRHSQQCRTPNNSTAPNLDFAVGSALGVGSWSVGS